MENTFRVLLVTDNHLGYADQDPVRKNDSFLTFEEILRNAVALDVDMILHAGDLFHENKPPKETLVKTAELLRTYCMGGKPSTVEVLSNTEKCFSSKFDHPNYLDPNYNVAVPIFAIHGNHDDAAGIDSVSPLEILGVSGLLNYFGRQTKTDRILLKPILFQKGDSFLALYGLGNIKDEFLERCFMKNNVEVEYPPGDRKWFSVLLLHQNRHRRGASMSVIHEKYLDSVFDLVVWGHEHGNLLTPTRCQEKGFHVTQPGSSIPTSASPEETTERSVGFLAVSGASFKIDRVPLYTPRPFVVRSFSLADLPKHILGDTKKTERIICDTIDEKLDETAAKWKEHCEEGRTSRPFVADLLPASMRPQLRVFLETDGKLALSTHRITQHFFDKIANGKNVVRLKQSTRAKRSLDNETTLPVKTPGEATVEDILQNTLAQNSLELLPPSILNEKMIQFIEKDEKNKLSVFLEDFLQSTEDTLFARKIDLDETAIKNAVDLEARLRRALEEHPKENSEEINQ
ncbi:MAG: DNA repair exonuclease MRE11 [Amphiamblys sp. WSBS2006]|nr:MAG: DNA repair exonuclease MRE11 [Amphiamblys sp. WSBS2006]